MLKNYNILRTWAHTGLSSAGCGKTTNRQAWDVTVSSRPTLGVAGDDGTSM